ncbi:iron-sulfur cluster assembly protein IscA [Scenedesmus sp. NREL 46B-D3]|nr:iron-sulfur cluster assembly protein IscA [Scenedesmus sp. NREL 46B-D3]
MPTVTLAVLAEAAKKVARSPVAKKAAVDLTAAAANRIRELLQARHKEYIKLGVKKRGCSGLSYTLNYSDSKGKFDELVEEHGVRLLIDPAALMHVLGTKMDYVDEPLKSEFVFINPNAKGSCGCGESFTTG